MRIAQVCPYDIDRPGGVQIHILDMAAALGELGHDVVIIAPNTGRPARDNKTGDVEVRRIGRARKIAFGDTSYEISVALGADWKELKALMAGFDVVHYHTVWTPFLAPQAFFCSRSPTVATFHDTMAPTLAGRGLRTLLRLVSRLLLPHIDVIVTPSDGPKENLVTTRPIIVLPPATDLRRFAPPVEQVERFRDGRLNILFLGRLEPRKGALLLLKAYQLLAGEGHNIRLIIAGGGEEEAGLRDYVRDHTVPDVHFTGPFQSSETPKWFATADIFCAPSPHGESFGIVITEAMASGKPVVAAANAGYRAILGSGEAAEFLTPPGDVEAIGRALRKLVTDASLRARLGEWGRREAARYDCRALAPRFVELYRQTIASRSRTAT